MIKVYDNRTMDEERIGLHEMAEKERRSTQPAVGAIDSRYSPPLLVVLGKSMSIGYSNGLKIDLSEEYYFRKETEVTR